MGSVICHCPHSNVVVVIKCQKDVDRDATDFSHFTRIPALLGPRQGDLAGNYCSSAKVPVPCVDRGRRYASCGGNGWLQHHEALDKGELSGRVSANIDFRWRQLLLQILLGPCPCLPCDAVHGQLL